MKILITILKVGLGFYYIVNTIFGIIIIILQKLMQEKLHDFSASETRDLGSGGGGG